jgi:tetratricopeptide (TPR) repeat protein
LKTSLFDGIDFPGEAEAVVEAFAAACRRVGGADGRARPPGVEAAVLRVLRGEIGVDPSAEASPEDSAADRCAAAESLSALGRHAQAFDLLRRLHPRRIRGVVRASMRVLPYLPPLDLFAHRRWVAELIAAVTPDDVEPFRSFIRLLAANAHLELVDSIRGSAAGALLAPADHALLDATRALWEARPSDAIRRLEGHTFGGADREQVDLLRAAARGLMSPGEEALASLEAIANDPSRSPAVRDTAEQFCGEIRVRLGRPDMRRVPDHPVMRVLSYLVEADHSASSGIAGVEELRVRFLLQQLCDAGFDLLRAPASQLDKPRLWDIIALFGGNRTATCTVLDGPHLRRVDLMSPRQRAASCQLRIPHDGPDEVLRALTELDQQWPGCSLFSVYKGEVLLWLGRYDDAARSFRRRPHKLETRWGFIGLGAALSHLGRDEEALEVWEAAREHDPEPLPGEATLTYRAEVHLRRGELIAARDLARRAILSGPTRLRAWLLGAEIALREDAIDEARAALVQAAALCPALFSRAADRASSWITRLRESGSSELLELCGEARARMRGNASRRLSTWVDTGGTFRAFAPVPLKDLAAALAPLGR